VVFVGAGQRHDEAARDLVRETVHVVDLRGQQQLADVGEHRLGHEVAGQPIGARIDARRHAAGIEALDDLDELDHRLAQAGLGARVQSIGLAHRRAGADQQVAEAGARADAGVAVVRGVAVGEHVDHRRRRAGKRTV